MEDRSMTEPELIKENLLLKQKIKELEQSERDIIDRRQAEEALKRSEAKYRSLFENAIEGIFQTTREGRYISTNPALAKLFGYDSPQELMEQITDIGSQHYVNSKDREIYKNTLEAKGVINEFETQLLNKKGNPIWASISARAVRDDKGSVVYYEGTVGNITGRKRAEEALRQSETRLSNIIEFLPDATFVIDLEGKIISWNRAIEEMTGFLAETMIGKGNYEYSIPFYGNRRPILIDFLTSWNEDIEKQYSFIQKEGNTLFTETDTPCVRGQKRTLWATASVLKDDHGNIIGAIESIRDVTERKRMEDQLAISEQQLRAILQASPVGIGRVRARVLEWVNEKMCQIAGYDLEKLQGRSSLLLYENETEYERVGNILYREGSVETKWVRKDGEVLDISIHTTQTSSYAYIFTAMDITDRKQAEEALKENERKFRTLFETANDAIFIMKDYLFVDCNRKTETMFYCGKQDIIGHSPIDFSPETQPDGLLSSKKGTEKMHMAMKGVPQFFEWKHLRMDGTPFDTEVSLNSIELSGDTYLQAIVRDITDRKSAEKEILQEREKLQILSDNAPFGLVLIDKKGHFTYNNNRFKELFGHDLSDVPDGSTWFRKAYPDKEYRHTVIKAWVEDFRDARPGERKPRVFTVTCKNGAQKIVEFIPSVLASGDYLMTCEDITELIRLESHLRQAQKMEAIGTLTGGIAHDFNNILTALIGYASLMRMKMDKDSPLRSYVDQIFSASKKAADLTQGLLAFSRQQPVTLAPLDMNGTIKSTKKLLKRLLTEDIELRTSLTGNDKVVMADKSQMDQILFNLVTNARDAMPKGGTLIIETDITDMDDVFTRTHGFGKPGKYVLITISDTGTGMDETTREKIFDPFFTTKETGKGTGLGLATVYGIIKQHNGYITVYSEPRSGTTFRIYLPAVNKKAGRETDAATPTVTGNETILIAEDNEEVRRFIEEALRQHGYKTIEAVDGEDAVDKFKQNRDIDLIVLDSVMPKKNGREVYEEIHGIDPNIMVLFTSGYTKDIVLDKGVEDGKFDFIAKPLLIDKFLQKIREVLDR